MVIDGSLAGYGRLTDPLRITMRGGRAVEASGDAGQRLMKTLETEGSTDAR